MCSVVRQVSSLRTVFRRSFRTDKRAGLNVPRRLKACPTTLCPTTLYPTTLRISALEWLLGSDTQRPEAALTFRMIRR